MISKVAIFVKCQVTAVATLSASSMRTHPRSLWQCLEPQLLLLLPDKHRGKPPSLIH